MQNRLYYGDNLEILTIGYLFEGVGVDMPPQHGTHQRASRWKRGM